MPIIGIGIDLTHISRIASSIERFGERFLNRVFHPREIEFSQRRKNNTEFLAACFAAKEATLKAFGDFPGRGISWSHIYITHEATGKPILNLEGKAKTLSEEKGVRHCHVSITHDGDTAIAQVILES